MCICAILCVTVYVWIHTLWDSETDSGSPSLITSVCKQSLPRTPQNKTIKQLVLGSCRGNQKCVWEETIMMRG